MLRGFFGNLIFAIFARMLCGNHFNSLNSQDINNIISVIIKSFQQPDWSSHSFAPGGLYIAKIAASSRFANVSDEEIAELNISAVRNMQLSMY